jgi:23S rRNA pseudouridine2605 synthase/23S rRNA pseudouridine2604 synthase
MTVKLQKYLASAGLCSRRKCEDLILAGKVKVNKKTATIGQRINPVSDIVQYKNKTVYLPEFKYYAFYKPQGVICSLSSSQGKSLKPFLRKIEEKVFPVGRLDKDSEGLLLLTNDGDWANELAHPTHDHEKEYEVVVSKPIPPHVLRAFKKGLLLRGKRLRSVKFSDLSQDRKKVNLVLKQGINRQIRRMFDKYDIEVKSLKRIRIDKFLLGNLKPGQLKPINVNK